MPRRALSCRGATADPRQPPCAQRQAPPPLGAAPRLLPCSSLGPDASCAGVRSLFKRRPALCHALARRWQCDDEIRLRNLKGGRPMLRGGSLSARTVANQTGPRSCARRRGCGGGAACSTEPREWTHGRDPRNADRGARRSHRFLFCGGAKRAGARCGD